MTQPIPFKLILASGSLYRQEQLRRLYVPFDIIHSDLDETPLEDEGPLEVVTRLSHEKAHIISDKHPEALVIGADQIGTFDGKNLIGKPLTREKALQQLYASSGKRVHFITGLSVLRKKDSIRQQTVVDTWIKFRELDDATIEAYLAAEPAYDCAGSVRAEGLGIALLESIESSDPSAIVGFPLISLCKMLRTVSPHFPFCL